LWVVLMDDLMVDLKDGTTAEHLAGSTVEK
jgi:hypothetical protein